MLDVLKTVLGKNDRGHNEAQKNAPQGQGFRG